MREILISKNNVGTTYPYFYIFVFKCSDEEIKIVCRFSIDKW
jgi:hypothetical protein